MPAEAASAAAQSARTRQYTCAHQIVVRSLIGLWSLCQMFAAERHDTGRCLCSLKSESRFFFWISCTSNRPQLCAAGACLAVLTRSTFSLASASRRAPAPPGDR
jgi:hypothetical protein